MQRVLITGGNGLLGTKVVAQLLRDGSDEVISTSREPCANAYLGEFRFVRLDITDEPRVREVLEEARPDVVIHTAAMTDVDGCETKRDEAWAINVEGTEHVARACERTGARLVHLSTEYVFDGRAGPYGEDDPVNPLGWYARTKYESERRVRAIASNWCVGRTTVLYGYAPHVRPNFVLWLIGRLREGQAVNIVTDQIGSPTLVDNLAEMVLALGASDRQGIYHTVGDTAIGRYDFARLAAQVFELDESLIHPITTDQLNQPALRPLRAGLRMDRFKAHFPEVPVLTAEEGLRELRRQLAAGNS
jgi:dTDP-4-dehydrorhamnose reductase